jgi:hypothetical protein
VGKETNKQTTHNPQTNNAYLLRTSYYIYMYGDLM